MLNLKEGCNSILESVKDYNIAAINEGESGVCLEFNEKGLEVALDDSDWSNFMIDNGAKFLKNDNDFYYYEMDGKLLRIPIDSVSDDDCDIYLDINNIEVC